MTQVEEIKKLLNEKNLKLKIAESFTGGRISSLITCVEGASTYLTEAIVCYSPQSKINRLGVKKELIDKLGTVSLGCIREMLSGLINSGDCDVAIATTGNASESIEGTSQRGECYVGVASRAEKRVFCYHLGGSRVQIIEYAAQQALTHLKELL